MQTVKTSGRGGAARRVTSIRIHRTKLVAPPRPPSFVRRARLDELVTRSVEQPLTLISAHAGTGKTALLASWATGRRDVAWLTVDRDDNWSPHFWQGVELALDGVLGPSNFEGERSTTLCSGSSGGCPRGEASCSSSTTSTRSRTRSC